MKLLMNLNKIILSILILSSCLKTTEEINQEKKTSKVKQVQTEQSHVILNNLISKNKQLEEQIMLLQGKIDDINYKNSQSSEEGKVEENLSEQVKGLQVKMDSIEEEMKTQRDFIQKVTESLLKIQKSLR